MSAPLSYFGFKKIDTAYQVRDRYQIAYDYYNLNNQNCTQSNVSVRETFDFNSKGNPKVRILYAYGDTEKELEPFTISYSEHGKAGAFQLFPVDKIDIKYDKLDILLNPRTDLILREKRKHYERLDRRICNIKKIYRKILRRTRQKSFDRNIKYERQIFI